MMTITLEAPAKINLWLDVGNKRPDGYHDIESVMQTVTLTDTLTITKNDGGAARHISISCSTDELACDESNLCYMAAQAFFSRTGMRRYSVAIHIEKRIPIAAGLAGGSTDAAATLIGLDRLYGTGLTTEELCGIGKRIGADVPFCVRRGISVTRGIGEIMSPCGRLPDCAILIACEGERVPTPWAYRMVDEMKERTGQETMSVDRFTSLLSEKRGIEDIASGMRNIFEDAVLPHRERARELFQMMEQTGAIRVMMSGSGPSVFGVYRDMRSAESAAKKLRENGIPPMICEPYYED